jgi:hypothetical protein
MRTCIDQQQPVVSFVMRDDRKIGQLAFSKGQILRFLCRQRRQKSSYVLLVVWELSTENSLQSCSHAGCVHGRTNNPIKVPARRIVEQPALRKHVKTRLPRRRNAIDPRIRTIHSTRSFSEMSVVPGVQSGPAEDEDERSRHSREPSLAT